MKTNERLPKTELVWVVMECLLTTGGMGFTQVGRTVGGGGGLTELGAWTGTRTMVGGRPEAVIGP